jgi:hypothetical protein
VNAIQTYVSSSEAVTVAQAQLLAPSADFAAWLNARVSALLETPTWFAPVHVGACRICDHCMCNTAAHVAVVLDHVPEAFTAAETTDVGNRLRRKFLEAFLEATGENPEWWYRPDTVSNWKIMCCGEGGLAACAFAGVWPEAPEALARAARGVLEILDRVPPEGDWGEGVGYWFTTLWMGLRLARALRRLTGGAVDLFRHPALRTTGDFLTQFTTPAGRVYNVADCDPALSPVMAEALLLLAAEEGRPDWAYAARLAPICTPLYLACDQPNLPAVPCPRRSARFPSIGAATLRTGWGPADVFVGLKSGPSAVGHGHLDANSLFLEAGGVPLVPEYPYWPQAHFLGFFEVAKGRWRFDGPATIGHSTILVDGQGQTYGQGCAGRILEVREGPGWGLAAGEAADCYPGRLRQFTRTILLLTPGLIVVRDLIEGGGERQVEWLLHYTGEMRGDGLVSVVENSGVRLAVHSLLPDRQQGWRWNDVTRTSLYECSDTRQMVTRAVRYRSFAPFRPATHFEFLFLLAIGDAAADASGLDFAGSAGDWTLTLPRAGWRVVPEGCSLACRG